MVRLKRLANVVAISAICLAGTTTLAAQPTTIPATTATSQPTTAPSRISFNFKDTPLDTILNILSQAAGFEILTDGPVEGRVTILSKQPVTPEEAVTMLNAALKANGFTVIREGKMLRIGARDKAKKGNLPVHFGADPADVADTEELITQVIPVQNLTASKLKDDLKPMMAADIDIAANDGSNTIIITDASSSIRRLVQIISELDQHEATTSELRIIQLKHANASATAKLLDTFFKEPAQPQQNQDPRQMMQQQGQGGPPPPSGGSQRHGQSVITAADDRTNTLLIQASTAQLKVIDAIIKQLDSDNPNPAPPSTMRAFPLKYADAEATAKMVNDIFKAPKQSESLEDILFGDRGRNEEKPGIVVNAVPDDRTNTVIVVAPESTLSDIASLITKLDTSPMLTQDIRVIHLKYADAVAVADVLTDMFKPKDKTNDSSPFRFLILSESGPPAQSKGMQINITSDVRTNTVLVTAPVGMLDAIEKITRQLDSDPSSEDTMFIYHLRNGQAQHLEYTLNVLFGNISAGNSPQNGQPQQNQNLLGQQNQNQLGNNSSSNSGSNSNQTNSSRNNNNNNRSAQNSRPGGSAIAQATSDFTGHVLVVAEPDTNSLLITTASKYEAMVRRIIDDLDHPVQQVLIKVLIAEVTHDNTDDLGLDFSVLNVRPSGNGQSAGTTFGLPTPPNGLVVNLLESNVTATLHALATRGKLDVLSRPYILASDNQEATITVGQSVPFVTNVQFNENNNPFSTVEYRDIGILLDVTPHINPDGLVIMDVTPEISSMTNSLIQLTPGVSSPVFQKRNASSRVNILDGQTIVIGGLMQDQNTATLQKVPILGDIPLLGLLFQRNQVEKTKTELLIFLTPHVAQMPTKLAPMSTDEEKGLRLTPDAVGPGIFQEHMRGMQRGDIPQTQPAVPISPVDSIEENGPTTQPAVAPQ
jgi:general secretion pathway protein D